ncbi:MAG: hypothetical protein HDR45_02995 [Bacteroides sp.]|nr:hypothetical protein [Bacteroides sp.]
MKLEDAWIKILEMENSEFYGPNMIHSILSDLGVFKTNPRIRLVLKAALGHNVWALIKKPIISNSEILSLKSKLDYDGFSDHAINTIIESFWHSNDSESKLRNENEFPQRSNAPTTINNRISASSSDQEISNYLNSVFNIDTESFVKRGLTLQNISDLEYGSQKGYYASYKGVSLSYEITGSKSCNISLNLYVYDIRGYLRDVVWIDSSFIKNEYSVINNSKGAPLSIPPHKVSKVVLKIDNNYSLSNIFDHNVVDVQRYDGNIECMLTGAEIVESQILHELSPNKGHLSFYIRFKVTKPIDPRRRYQSYYALIYDLKGILRQRCNLLSMGSMNSIDLFKVDMNSEFFFISEESILDPNVLKIPFNEIGKITIIDEV